jgi:hypothetical protein
MRSYLRGTQPSNLRYRLNCRSVARPGTGSRSPRLSVSASCADDLIIRAGVLSARRDRSGIEHSSNFGLTAKADVRPAGTHPKLPGTSDSWPARPESAAGAIGRHGSKSESPSPAHRSSLATNGSSTNPVVGVAYRGDSGRGGRAGAGAGFAMRRLAATHWSTHGRVACRPRFPRLSRHAAPNHRSAWHAGLGFRGLAATRHPTRWVFGVQASGNPP